MSLPDLIEIVPLTAPVHAEITVPGSKSITNRALILAALAEGEVTLQGALWSEDTQIMVECLQELGFMVNVADDPGEPSNRTITVYGKRGLVPPGGTEAQPMDLFVGNAGTAARFLAAFVCLGSGVYRLSGIPRMHERPQAALFVALRELGYRVESEKGNDKLPVRIWGDPAPHRRSCTVSVTESSQFASALHLGAKQGGWDIKVVGDNEDELPYVVMTTALVKRFPHQGGVFLIEQDASSSSYIYGARWLLNLESQKNGTPPDMEVGFGAESLKQYPSKLQMDSRFDWSFLDRQQPVVSRKTDLADSIMTAIVLAPFADKPTKFTDLGRLRVQECERVVALRTELTKCGAKVIEEGDTLTVSPAEGTLHGAEIETYNDHRMAMCFAILGLKVPGIKIKNPACVKKTFPNFFQKLAAPAPHGLGVEIRDAKTQRVLSVEELFAD